MSVETPVTKVAIVIDSGSIWRPMPTLSLPAVNQVNHGSTTSRWFGAITKSDANTITEKTLGILGCPNCHSGFDIRFIQEQVILVDRKLEAKQFSG